MWRGQWRWEWPEWRLDNHDDFNIKDDEGNDTFLDDNILDNHDDYVDACVITYDDEDSKNDNFDDDCDFNSDDGKEKYFSLFKLHELL